MRTIRFGIVDEASKLKDKRTAFTPSQIISIKKKYPGADFVIQNSDHRCFTNEEYQKDGIKISENLEECDFLFGIKEVPVDALLPEKSYMFFSHTIKKQEKNRELLKSIIAKKIRLIDYECLTDKKGSRLLGFGWFAGIVGAYNTIATYGHKLNLFNLPPAHHFDNLDVLHRALNKVKLPPVKIIITGTGRVGTGAFEVLSFMKLKEISPEEIVTGNYNFPAFARLYDHHYNKHRTNSNWDLLDFFKHPENYISTFGQYINHADIFIHCAFWHPSAPRFFTKEDMLKPEFKIKVIGDISCDLNGPIPSTLKTCTINDPVYGYNPSNGNMESPYLPHTIDVMSVDNLPCSIPKGASEKFGNDLMDTVIPLLLEKDEDNIIERATITQEGKLMPGFSYLSDFVGE